MSRPHLRVLLLGGTTEASALAEALARHGIDAVFSYAGRTAAPRTQPLPTRSGGFGGVEGLTRYLTDQRITHVVDATHPFAAGISRNADAACGAAGLPLLALERAEWQAGPDDRWHLVASVEDAVAALPGPPARVFLAIGKQTIAAFASRPQHHYLLRLVDPPEAPLPLPDCAVVIDRGPFTAAGDAALLAQHRISHVVAKNAGGAGAEAKLVAARLLGLPVILIRRHAPAARTTATTVAEVLDWLQVHAAPPPDTGPEPAAKRGV